MTTIFKKIILIMILTAFVVGCDTPAPLVTVVQTNVDSNPLKVVPLTETQEKSWVNRLDDYP